MKWKNWIAKCSLLRACFGILSIVVMALFWTGALKLPRQSHTSSHRAVDPFGNQTATSSTAPSAIVLLGDSILNNEHYVAFNETVFAHLKQTASATTPVVPVFQYAEDNAMLMDVSQQIEQVGAVSRYNTPTAWVVVSMGGNHLLNKRPFQLNDTVLEELYAQWKEVFAKLKRSVPNASIAVVNLYQPANALFGRYAPFIEKWNQWLEANADTAGATYQVVDVHSLLSTATDFVADVEPSAEGGQKIANAIWLTCGGGSGLKSLRGTS